MGNYKGFRSVDSRKLDGAGVDGAEGMFCVFPHSQIIFSFIKKEAEFMSSFYDDSTSS